MLVNSAFHDCDRYFNVVIKGVGGGGGGGGGGGVLRNSGNVLKEGTQVIHM